MDRDFLGKIGFPIIVVSDGSSFDEPIGNSQVSFVHHECNSQPWLEKVD